MIVLVIKIIPKPYNKLLSRAESYLKNIRLDEKDYYIKYFMVHTLIPSNNKITSCKKIDDGLVLQFKKNNSNINLYKNNKFFIDLEKKLYYNKLTFELNYK